MNPKIAARAPVADSPAWLLFILTLQGQQPAVRMRIWRALKALGGAVLRDGVYLIPNRPELIETLEAQSDAVTASGGSALIFEIDARDEKQNAEFRQLFDRTADYEKLMLDIGSAKKDLDGSDRSALSARLARLRRAYAAIEFQDLFPGAAREQAREALDDFAATVDTALSPDEPRAAAGRIQPVDPALYQGRTWATRARPWADRLASGWLIRRFIDRRAKFVWLKSPKECPKRAVGFDFDGAAFTHVGAKVTFEVLLVSFALDRDPALERIGALIHYLDVGGVPVSDAAGFEALLGAARAAIDDDDRLLVEAGKLFDLLHASFGASA